MLQPVPEQVDKLELRVDADVRFFATRFSLATWLRNSAVFFSANAHVLSPPTFFAGVHAFRQKTFQHSSACRFRQVQIVRADCRFRCKFSLTWPPAIQQPPKKSHEAAGQSGDHSCSKWQHQQKYGPLFVCIRLLLIALFSGQRRRTRSSSLLASRNRLNIFDTRSSVSSTNEAKFSIFC